jgi:hypothetical protein
VTAWSTCRDGVVREQAFVPVTSGRCLTVVDRPAEGDARATVVLAHGLTGDRVGPAELLAGWSARLCRALRVRVVRFDFRGGGDSDGAFEALTFAGMTRDLVEVAVQHAEPARPLVCAGISIGGVPAALAAHALQQRGDVDVGAVLLLSSDLVEGVRFATAGHTAIRGGEFHLPEAFFREREDLAPRTALVSTGLPFLLVHGTLDGKLVAAAEWFAAHGGQVVAVEGDHLFQSTQGRRRLHDACAGFLRQAIPGIEDAP